MRELTVSCQYGYYAASSLEDMPGPGRRRLSNRTLRKAATSLQRSAKRSRISIWWEGTNLVFEPLLEGRFSDSTQCAPLSDRYWMETFQLATYSCTVRTGEKINEPEFEKGPGIGSVNQRGQLTGHECCTTRKR